MNLQSKGYPGMQFLVYASNSNRCGHIVLETLRIREPAIHSEHITSLEELGDHLRKPMGAVSIGILIPSDGGELSALVKFRHLMRDMRLILVLPDGDASSTTTAHLLRPRYISYCDGDLCDVIAVASKMAGALNPIPGRILHLNPKRRSHRA